MEMVMVEMNEHDEIDLEHEEDQTFAPTAAAARAEKSRVTTRGRQIRLVSLERLTEHAKNRYEGVLIAAARARQLNAKKTAMEERGMEEAVELKRLKMTTHALEELVGGQIKVERPRESF